MKQNSCISPNIDIHRKGEKKTVKQLWYIYTAVEKKRAETQLISIHIVPMPAKNSG